MDPTNLFPEIAAASTPIIDSSSSNFDSDSSMTLPAVDELRPIDLDNHELRPIAEFSVSASPTAGFAFSAPIEVDSDENGITAEDNSMDVDGVLGKVDDKVYRAIPHTSLGQVNGKKKHEFATHILDEINRAAASKVGVPEQDFVFLADDFPVTVNTLNATAKPYVPTDKEKPSFMDTLVNSNNSIETV